MALNLGWPYNLFWSSAKEDNEFQILDLKWLFALLECFLYHARKPGLKYQIIGDHEQRERANQQLAPRSEMCKKDILGPSSNQPHFQLIAGWHAIQQKNHLVN